MLTQRDIDIWRADAEEYALKIREQFMQNLTGERIQIPQPGQQQAQPRPQPPANSRQVKYGMDR